MFLARDLLNRQVFHAAHVRHGVTNTFSHLRERVPVFAKNLDRNLGVDADKSSSLRV